MKKIYFLLFGLIGCCACNDLLNVKPENAVTYTNFFKDEKDIHSAFVDMYAKLRDVYYGFYVMQPLDKIGLRYDANNTSGEYTDELKGLSVNAFKQTIISWGVYYSAIFQANLIADNMYRADGLIPERKAFYRGHLCFVKALMYYEIARRWGDAPITRNSYNSDALGRSPAKVVLDTAVANALVAYALLEKPGESKNYNGEVLGKYYAHKGAAAALLANIYAWKGGVFDDKEAYQEAEKYCSLILENQVGDYELEPTPEEVCLHKQLSCESVFELLNNPDDFASGLTTGRYHTGINYHIGENYGYGGYPLNPQAGIADNQFNTLYLLKNETVKAIWEDGDLRRQAYFWKFDEMEQASAEITGGFAYPYFWRTPAIDADWGEMVNVSGNRIFWRLADLYLLRAEARCRAGLPGAEDDLNVVRNRAHASLYPASQDTEGLQMAIFREREKELFFDGERYFDIIRNGYYRLPGMISPAYAALTAADVEGGALYLPIPDSEMQRNSLMRRNPYWLAKW